LAAGSRYSSDVRTLGRTPEEYLASLPADRELALSAVREAILGALPAGYEEHLRDTAIYYEIPRERMPPGYRSKPLIYAGLASQARHMAVYLRSIYYDQGLHSAFVARWLALGKPLDMGKTAVRFQSLDDVPLELIADTVAEYEVADYIELYTSYQRLR